MLRRKGRGTEVKMGVFTANLLVKRCSNMDFQKVGRVIPVREPVPGDVVEPESARRQVERILTSAVFRDAPIQQRLLRYLVDHALAGSAGDLKEFAIGAAVFARGDTFDPRTDSIVRVQAGVLRKKLAVYYEGPGAGDELIVEIPRGHYAPSFSPRAPDPRPQRHHPRWPWVYPAAAAVAGTAVGAVAVWLAIGMASPPMALPVAHPSAWANHPLWKGFFEPGSTVKLVIGAPVFADVNGLLIRDVDVNRPEDLSSSATVRLLERERHAKSIPVEIYTGMGEAEGASLLSRFFTQAGIDLPLIRNRQTRWQDLSAGNLIFVASLRFRTLGRELDRPNDFQFITEPGHPPVLKNLRPQPGEDPLYQFAMTSRSSGRDYALVTVWPSTFPGRRVMFIGGSTTWGTAAGVSYVTDPLSLRELRERIGPREPAGKTGLQVLLRVDIRDNEASSTTFVTSHWLP